MSLIEDLQWRYATKKMNGKKVPQEKVDYILEAARLAPTSSGLQPFKIFVVTNKELLKKIQPIASGQTQITDCSHLLIFAAWDEYTDERISAIFNHTTKERGLPDGFMNDYKNSLLNGYIPMGKDWMAHHAAKQSYIAFGIAIAAAAEQKVDATPMEGFNNAELDKLMEFDKMGLKSTVLLPLGYREEKNDWLVKMKKVRNAKENFIVEIN